MKHDNNSKSISKNKCFCVFDYFAIDYFFYCDWLFSLFFYCGEYRLCNYQLFLSHWQLRCLHHWFDLLHYNSSLFKNTFQSKKGSFRFTNSLHNLHCLMHIKSWSFVWWRNQLLSPLLETRRRHFSLFCYVTSVVLRAIVECGRKTWLNRKIYAKVWAILVKEMSSTS